MTNETKNIIPSELKENDFFLNLIAVDLSNDNTPEAEKYKQQIKAIAQEYFNNSIDTYTALNQIRRELVNYDCNVVAPRDKQKKQERKEELYIDNPFDVTELAVKNNVHEYDIFLNGLFGLLETIGVENLGLTDSKGNLITDTIQLKGGNQRKKADLHIRQYLDYKRRPDIKRYAIEVTDIFDEPIITVFLGQGQAHSGFYLNRLTPIIVELFLAKKENEVIITTFSQLAEKIKLVNHNYNVYANIDYCSNSDYLIEQAQKYNELFSKHQFRQFYKNAFNVINNTMRDLLNKLDRSYSAIRVKENHLIIARDNNDNTYSFTSNDCHEDMIRYAQAKILQEMNIPTIERVFLKRKAQQFFGRVIEYINKEYNQNWTHYKSQLEIKIISRSQLQKCYDEYIVKNRDIEVSLEECRERLKKRLLHKVDNDIDRAERKYNELCNTTRKELQQSYDNSEQIKDLVEISVYNDEDREQYINQNLKKEIKKQDPWKCPPNYKDIQAEIMKFLIDSADNQR